MKLYDIRQNKKVYLNWDAQLSLPEEYQPLFGKMLRVSNYKIFFPFKVLYMDLTTEEGRTQRIACDDYFLELFLDSPDKEGTPNAMQGMWDELYDY